MLFLQENEYIVKLVDFSKKFQTKGALQATDFKNNIAYKEYKELEDILA